MVTLLLNIIDHCRNILKREVINIDRYHLTSHKLFLSKGTATSKISGMKKKLKERQADCEKGKILGGYGL